MQIFNVKNVYIGVSNLIKIMKGNVNYFFITKCLKFVNYFMICISSKIFHLKNKI